MLAHNITVSENAIALISDCEHADFFMVNNPGSNNFLHPPLSQLYQTNARFGLLQAQIYFIKATARTYTDGQPIYALYRKNTLQKPLELVAGISQLHIEYSSASSTFVPANQISNWNTVTKIKIAFISEAAQLNTIVNHEFSFIIRLRNRP